MMSENFLEKIYQILVRVFQDSDEENNSSKTSDSIGIYALSTLEVTGPFGI